MLTDWNRGKDFRIQDVSSPHDGRAINLGDAEKFLELQGCTFQIYYRRLIDFCLIRKVGDEWKVVGSQEEDV